MTIFYIKFLINLNVRLDREDAKKMATDPMFKLEHGVKDQQKSKAVQPTLGQLQVNLISLLRLPCCLP